MKKPGHEEKSLLLGIRKTLDHLLVHPIDFGRVFISLIRLRGRKLGSSFLAFKGAKRFQENIFHSA